MIIIKLRIRRMSTTTIPHNLSILSKTKVNIGQNWRGKKFVNWRYVGSSSSTTLSAKHLSNLKSDNPTQQCRRKFGGGDICPMNLGRSANHISIRGQIMHTTLLSPPPGFLDLPTVLQLITIFTALLLCQ